MWCSTSPCVTCIISCDVDVMQHVSYTTFLISGEVDVMQHVAVRHLCHGHEPTQPSIPYSNTRTWRSQTCSLSMDHTHHDSHCTPTPNRGNLQPFCVSVSCLITLACTPVLAFSKLNNFIFGYFDPENIFLDNENK